MEPKWKRANLPTLFTQEVCPPPPDTTEAALEHAKATGGVWHMHTADFEGMTVPIEMARDMMDIRDREDCGEHRARIATLLERCAIAEERKAAAYERIAAVMEQPPTTILINRFGPGGGPALEVK